MSTELRMAEVVAVGRERAVVCTPDTQGGMSNSSIVARTSSRTGLGEPVGRATSPSCHRRRRTARLRCEQRR